MIKRINRKIFYPLLYKLKIPNNILKKNGGSFVQCYHGVLTNPNLRLNNRHMDVLQFEKDLLFYKSNFEIVPLNDLFQTENLNTTKPRIALTFDDGYLNNFTEVLPLISKHKIPVTFFIITGSLNSENFITWYDLVDFVKSGNLEEIEFNKLIFIRNKFGSYTNNEISIEAYIKKMKSERDMALMELMNKYIEIVDAAKKNYPGYWKLVGAETLKQHVSNPYLTIGSHTHSHFNLEHQDESMVREELLKSKTLLEAICPYKINSIAYPDGSYNDSVKKTALELGYNLQLAVEYKSNEDLNDSHLRNRFSLSSSTTHEANMLKMAIYSKKYGHQP